MIYENVPLAAQSSTAAHDDRRPVLAKLGAFRTPPPAPQTQPGSRRGPAGFVLSTDISRRVLDDRVPLFEGTRAERATCGRADL